ncbi:MAG: S-layer homology domain-containing protein, partial [Thermacetogeniaceae bacterium]
MPGSVRICRRKIAQGMSPLAGRLSAVVASFVFLAALLSLTCALATTGYAAAFSDTKGHWAEAAIEQAAEAGYIRGYPDGTFHPDQRVTRAEFVAVLNAAFDVPKPASAAISFKDVSTKDWFAEAVRAAAAAGYVSGYPDGTFRPYQSVTRVEAAAFLARLLNISGGAPLKFADASQIDEWARPAVAALVGKGVLSGYPDGTFRPKRSITRA